MKKLLHEVGNQYRRVVVELGRLELDASQKDREKPKRPFKASTIALICVFLGFAALIIWLSHRAAATAIR
jgi:hypothetical protein